MTRHRVTHAYIPVHSPSTTIMLCRNEALTTVCKSLRKHTAVAPQCTHLVVRVPGVSRMTVARAVCVVKAIMTASSDSEVLTVPV